MPVPSADSASAVGFTPYTRADGVDGRCASSNSSRLSSAPLSHFRAIICGGNAPAKGKPASNGEKCSVFEQNFPTFSKKWGSFFISPVELLQLLSTEEHKDEQDNGFRPRRWRGRVVVFNFASLALAQGLPNRSYCVSLLGVGAGKTRVLFDLVLAGKSFLVIKIKLKPSRRISSYFVVLQIERKH